MKILHLLDIPWWSGLAAYAFECIEAHEALGHSVELACEGEALPHRKAEQMRLETVSLLGRKGLGSAANFAILGRRILDSRPDVLVAHTGSMHWIARFWGKRVRARVIRTRATSQKPLKSRINRIVYAGSHRIVAGSEQLRRECLDLCKEPNQVKTIYPPIETPVRPTARRDGVTVGIVARLDPVKGHEHLFRAFKTVQQTCPSAELRLAGPEENVRWGTLLALARDLGLRNVEYRGFLKREELVSFMAECSVGVVSSVGSEEVSRALLEWMSLGVPVVATRVGCIPEIVREGQTGWVVPPQSHESLANKIGDLLLHSEQRARMGEEARRLCAERFSKRIFQDAWREVLSS